MLTNGTRFFVQILDSDGKKTLHPALIVSAEQGRFTAVSTEAALELEPGLESLIFFEWKKEFTQQSMRIDMVMPKDADFEFDEGDLSGPYQQEFLSVFAFETVGEPVSAENRQCYRVSAVMADVSVSLGEEKDCKVQDISAMGFSALARQLYMEGSIIDVTLHFEGEQYSGKARIQNATKHPSELIRYGFHGINVSNVACPLEQGRQKISMAIQRRQLQRSKRSA